MALAFHDKWIWDFWIVEDDDGLFHVFYLQASKSLGDPERRHRNVSIGHAVSSDLTNWSVRPDALTPSPAPAWDDAATWTGSILRHEGIWYLFYTGTSEAEDALVQRVGMARSHDLNHWEKHQGSLIEADATIYERLGDHWPDEAWRDPWVFLGDDGSFHALITARTRTGTILHRGCLAHARSKNLVDWEVLEPVTTPGGFGQLEVPQLQQIDGSYVLLFCCDAELQSEERRFAGTGTGTFYLSASRPLGPFAIVDARPLEVDLAGSAYAGRLIETKSGLQYLSWLRTNRSGGFVGELSDPRPVLSNGEGILLK